MKKIQNNKLSKQKGTEKDREGEREKERKIEKTDTQAYKTERKETEIRKAEEK